MEDGPPMFRQDVTCPVLLVFIVKLVFMYGAITLCRCAFQHIPLTPSKRLRANPRSLAATRGISVDFFSSGYLDVSVPRVCLFNAMNSR